MLPYSWWARFPSRSLDTVAAGGVWVPPSVGNISAVQLDGTASAGYDLNLVVPSITVVVDQSVTVRAGWSATALTSVGGFIFFTDMSRVGDGLTSAVVRSQSAPAAPTFSATIAEFMVPALTPMVLPFQIVQRLGVGQRFTMYATKPGVGIGMVFGGGLGVWLQA